MTILSPIINPLFYGLVILQLTALFFFGLAMLLRWWTAEPVERIRITMTAFCAIPVLFVLAMTPFLPRWSIALWHEPPIVSQTPTSAETFYSVPVTHNLATLPMIQGFDEDATNQSSNREIAHEQPLSQGQLQSYDCSSESLAYAAGSDSGGHGVTALPLILLVKGCIVIVVFAVSFVMIVMQLVAMLRLRRMMRTALPVPGWVEQLFREYIENDFSQRRRDRRGFFQIISAPFASLRETIRIRVSPHIDSPLLCGLLRPMILLPDSMMHENNIAQIRYALAHEWSHHCNGDLAAWCFASVCRVLFWVQPFYWHLTKELRVDQDFLTDDAASRTNIASTTNSNTSTITTFENTPETDVEQYASVLLELAKRRMIKPSTNQSPGELSALGFADTTPFITRRIEMLLKEKPRFRGKTRLAWLLATCFLFFGLAVIFGSVRLTTIGAETLPTTTTTTVYTPPEVKLEDEIFVELRLLVVDDEQNPVPGAQVELRYSDWSHPIEEYWETDTDGMVVTKISQLIIDNRGSFRVYHKERGLIGRTNFPTDKPGIVDPMEVTCKLIKARRLTGQVLDQGGKPVEGAFVGGTWSFRIGCNLTDDQGHFFIDVTPEQPMESIFAFKPGVGYDSLFPDVKPNDLARLYDHEAWRKEENHDNGPFTFKLDKGKTYTVKVVDGEGNPIEGALVYPNGGGFTKEHIFEVNCFESLMGQITDQEGFVKFDWLPSWLNFSFFANGSNPRFDKTGNARFYGTMGRNSSVEQGDDETLVVITLSKRLEIQGSVRLEDGSPVPWHQLCIHAKNFATVGEYTDHAGNFSYDVSEGDPITVLPTTRYEQPLVAPAIYVESVGDGTTPAPRFDFVLKKGTKLFGRVLSPETGKAVPTAYIRIYEMRSPDDTVENHVFDERYAHVDGDGNYSVQLPPGLFRFKIDDREIPEPLKITDEEEIHLDF